ncbi:DUF4158 domain-containing protein [Brucella pituitosa]|uniref:DUF4158 domain-containing protein n=1 Tax=Brucella pituitosa TaxID=571256 RepID=UPI0009A24573
MPQDAVECIAQQFSARADDLSSYDFGGRTVRRHCTEILQYLGFRRATGGPGGTVFLD